MSRPLAIALTAVTMATLSGGCVSYRWGSGSALGFNTIYVKPARNNSFAPQAQTIVSTKVREALIRDGRVQVLANEADADAVLIINLSDYSRTPAARSSVDTQRARSLEIDLIAEISLYDQSTGEYRFQNRLIKEETDVHIGNPFRSNLEDSYQQAEFQAIPRLARDLARKIADEILSIW